MITKKTKKPLQAHYALAREGDDFLIQRNERQLMSPAGNPYKVRQEKLATSILKEWESQGDKIVPDTMPLTQLLATTLDITHNNISKTQQGLVAYIPTELLCYRAEKPEPLVEKQNALWQPYLDWCTKTYNAHYNIGLGLMPIEQDQTTVDHMEKAICSYDEMHLTALSCATDCTGSLVLSLALIEGFRPATDIFEACELDITDQATRWGEDPVTEERHKKMMFELESCERWIELIKA